MAFCQIFRMVLDLLNLLIVVSDGIARAFIRSGATWAIALDISKASDRVWHTGLLYKLSDMEFQVRYLALCLLFSVIDCFEWFYMGNLQKNIQLMLEFHKAAILVLHFSYYTFIIFLIMLSVILLSMLMILLYSKSDEESNLWQQLELASTLESDLQDTVEWGRKWLVDFNAVKTQLILFDRSKNTGAIVKMWKQMGLLLKNHLLRCWGWLSLLNWIEALTLFLVLKLPPRKLVHLFVS